MSFLFEFFQHKWQSSLKQYEQEDLKAWINYLDAAEKDRQLERITFWRDRVANNDFAANSEEPEFYRRTAGFVWRVKDPSGTHKARDHQYLYNLEVYGHKVYSRRDKSELATAHDSVKQRVAKGELGPLSPLE